MTTPHETASLQRRMTAKFESPEEAAKLQRHHSTGMSMAGEHVMELEWEEWDGTGSYVHHCVAGSFAGVAEHVLLYPVDTIKTQMQAFCADCPKSKLAATGGMLDTTRQLMSGDGFGRLWRGVQSMMAGCIPAHALYFSSYEAIKALFTSEEQQNLGPLGSSVAGASAAFCHDSIMTPADTIKQRLQLGHYQGMSDAIRNILQNEGPVGLYRSFPITLLTNLPYGT